MAVFSALRRTPPALSRNPVVFVPVLVLMLFQIPQFVLRPVSPFLAGIVSTAISLAFVFVMPFFVAGVIGMAAEALDGRTALSTFVREGKANYVSVLVAALVVFAVNLVLWFVAFVGVVFGGAAIFVTGVRSISPWLLAGIGVLAGIVLLAYVAFVFLIQFYGQAIVLDGFDAVAGLKHSTAVVRDNLASAIGYSLVVTALGGVAGVFFAVASFLVAPEAPSILPMPDPGVGGIVAVIVLVLAIGTLLGGFLGVYAVAFYRELTR